MYETCISRMKKIHVEKMNFTWLLLPNHRVRSLCWSDYYNVKSFWTSCNRHYLAHDYFAHNQIKYWLHRWVNPITNIWPKVFWLLYSQRTNVNCSFKSNDIHPMLTSTCILIVTNVTCATSPSVNRICNCSQVWTSPKQ
jgi:hypothetical protein